MNAKPIEIRPVEGITTNEIERAMKVRKLYLAVGARWNTQGGGYATPTYRVSLTRFRPYRPAPVIFNSPGMGPTDTALTRAVLFNADRTEESTSVFLTDPAIQAVADMLRSLPVPEMGAPMQIYAWHRKSGALVRCGA